MRPLYPWPSASVRANPLKYDPKKNHRRSTQPVDHDYGQDEGKEFS